MNNNIQIKPNQILILCIVLSFLIAPLVSVIERNSKEVESETSPAQVVDPAPTPEAEEKEEEEEVRWPHQKYYYAGWDKCLDNLHVDCDVAFLGDSITYQSWFDRDFPDVTICNLGVVSDNIRALTYRVGTIQTVRAEKVFVMIGINSLQNDNLDRCIKDYETLVDTIYSWGDYDLYLISITPLAKNEEGEDDPTPEIIVSFNEAIADIAAANHATYLDLHSQVVDSSGYIRPEYTKDGIHLSDEGYEVWADLMRPYIEG